MTNYCVVYYYPDGYGNADKVEFEGTNEQCLEYIKNEIGGTMVPGTTVTETPATTKATQKAAEAIIY